MSTASFRSLVGADLFLSQSPTQRALCSSCAGAPLVERFVATALADLLDAPTEAINQDVRLSPWKEKTLDNRVCAETLQALQCRLVVKLCQGMNSKGVEKESLMTPA
ncbi:uncharacterized protein N7518_008138 [Penicillium psychrosexuale]|uniref:uncharacterized protein n=1 Tax=Penicillium psychrosexuale TaxID=1002107 RepID=UPI0025454EF4|nr:uncharacterized protein N7518_008138 [Penicillium psychrosexuale]KAJ5791127.1 hypothetical protein N7518_008138 [Penicillium psychrosexuale]